MKTFKIVAALLLGGITLAGAADAQDYRGERRSQPVVSIGLGNVAFGYRDGYWDNGHRWHHGAIGATTAIIAARAATTTMTTIMTAIPITAGSADPRA